MVNYHFSEYDTDFWNVFFYRVETINGNKMVIFEYQTDNRIDDDLYDYCYYRGFASYNYPLFSIHNKKDDITQLSNANLFCIGMKELMRFGYSNNLRRFFSKIPTDMMYGCNLSLEEAFVVNDTFLNNDGNGRELLHLRDLNILIPDGKYWDSTYHYLSSDYRK